MNRTFFLLSFLVLPLGLQAMETTEQAVNQQFEYFDQLPDEIKIFVLEYPTIEFLNHLKNLSFEQLYALQEKIDLKKTALSPFYARANKKLRTIAQELVVKSLNKHPLHEILTKEACAKIQAIQELKGFGFVKVKFSQDGQDRYYVDIIFGGITTCIKATDDILQREILYVFPVGFLKELFIRGRIDSQELKIVRYLLQNTEISKPELKALKNLAACSSVSDVFAECVKEQ